MGAFTDERENLRGVREHLDMSAFGFVTGGVLCGLNRVVQGLIHIYGQTRSHSIRHRRPTRPRTRQGSIGGCMQAGHAFWKRGRREWKGRAKVVGFLNPCFIHVPLMASPEEVRCGNTPSPLSSFLSIGDVRVLIDRRKVSSQRNHPGGKEEFHML